MTVRLARPVLVVAVLLAATAVPSLGAGVASLDPGAARHAAADGPVVLGAGTAGVSLEPAEGEWHLDVTPGERGLAPGGRYTFGDPAAPTEEMAFTVTHRVAEARTMTVAYAGVDAAGDGIEHVRLRVYDAAGRHLGTASEERPLTVRAGPAGSTYYVVLVVDTHGLAAGADLSGTFRVLV